jgi:hypothetical protein
MAGLKNPSGPQGRIVCINGQTGNLIWTKDFKIGYVDYNVPLSIGDLDNNGDYELVQAADSRTVARHAENGSEFWNVSVPSGWHYFIIADVDGTGYPYVYVSDNKDTPPYTNVSKIRGYDGALMAQADMYYSCYGGVSCADLNGDGEYEILVTDRGSGYGPQAKGVRCYDENLNLLWYEDEITCSSHCAVPVDINGDGVLEVVVLSQGSSGGIYVLNADGTEVPGKCSKYLGLGCHVQPAVYDIDKDGNIELITAYGSYPKVWDLGNWALDAILPDVICSEPPDFANVMGDGDLEIIACSGYGTKIYDSSYTLIASLPYSRASVVQDIDGDGLNEIILLRNNSLMTYDTLAVAPTPQVRTDTPYYSEQRANAGVYVAPIFGDNQSNSPPNNPSNPSPANNTNGVNIVSNLSWIGGDPNNDTVTFDVYFGTTSTPLKVSNNQSTTVYNPGTMNTGTTYYWKITAWDNHSTSKKGPLWHFKTNTPPSTPNNPNPTNSSTGISKTADLSWTCSDPDSNPLTYDIYFGTANPPQKVTGNTSTATYDPGTMNTGTTYYWKITAWDNHSTSKKGPLWHFKTNTPFTIQSNVSWWNLQWMYRKKITINHTKVTDTLIDFPLLIHITDPDLASKAQTNGNDIVFANKTGIKLNHEIEYYNSATGELVSWVKVPVLSSSQDTIVYLYYGNQYCSNQQNITNTWDVNFLAVHHLDETAGTLFDSTSHHNNGTPYGTPNQDGTGKIDGACYFDGINDHFILPQVFSTQSQFTMEAWIYPQTGARYFISQFRNSQGHGVFLQVGYNPDHIEWYINSNSSGIAGITLNTWYHIVLTYDGTTARIYKNAGTPNSKACAAPAWPAEGMYIGDRSAGGRQFHGMIDEVRLSSIARSSAWISTEYNNQNNPSGFYSVGAEEYNPCWQFRKKIIIDHTKVSGTLVNFPVLIHINDSDLAMKAQPDGDDIYFTDYCNSKLNHEIEYYNTMTGKLVAWVNVPVLSSTTDTVLFMLYGNPSAGNQENIEGTWDSHYLAVHHLDETSGTVYDSTSQNKDGTLYGTLNQDIQGRIDGADSFDGINDHFILPQVFSTQSQFTMEAWIYPQIGARYFISQFIYSQGHGVFLQVGANPDHIEWYINSNSGGIAGISLNTWYHIVLTYDGTTARIYKNAGTPISNVCNAPTWPVQGLYIGDRSVGSRQFHGIIDEVRLSNIARSSAWISTEYNNQNNPSGFYSVGNEENT